MIGVEDALGVGRRAVLRAHPARIRATFASTDRRTASPFAVNSREYVNGVISRVKRFSGVGAGAFAASGGHLRVGVSMPRGVTCRRVPVAREAGAPQRNPEALLVKEEADG